MSGNSQAGRKKLGVCVCMKAQAKEIRQSLIHLPGCSWSCHKHVVMEPVVATGSVGNHVWDFIMGADGGPLICVDIRVVGGLG